MICRGAGGKSNKVVAPKVVHKEWLKILHPRFTRPYDEHVAVTGAPVEEELVTAVIRFDFSPSCGGG
jgi:hypothetical protein